MSFDPAQLSIALFANRTLYTAPVSKTVPQIGDLTFPRGLPDRWWLYAILNPPKPRNVGGFRPRAA